MQRIMFVAIALMALIAGRVEATVERDSFGSTGDGQAVERYTLENGSGALVSIITYGGIVTQLRVKDRDGNLGDVVLGSDDLGQYETENPYFGCIAGRVANRIAGGKFTLDGQSYEPAVNNGPNHLHGGRKGFDKVVWDAAEVQRDEGVAVRLSYLSKDGEEGYPEK